MIEEGWGRIVNISSSSAHGGQPLMTHYVASKAGVIGFTKALALELGPKGITVNTIPPGFIDTPMLRASESKGLLGEGVEHHAALTPVRRVGRPEDIAAACAFLVRTRRATSPGRSSGSTAGGTPEWPRLTPAARRANGRRLHARGPRRRCVRPTPATSPPRDEGPAQGAERPRDPGPAPRPDEGLQHLQRLHPLRLDAVAAPARAARPPGGLGPPVGLRVGAAPRAGRRCRPRARRGGADRPGARRPGLVAPGPGHALGGGRAHRASAGSRTPPGRCWPPSSTSSS